MSANKPPRRSVAKVPTLAPANETLIVGDHRPPASAPAPVEQPPATSQNENPPPARASAPEAPKPRRKPAKTTGTPVSARQAWEASVMLARNSPRDWEPYTVRLPEEVWRRLEAQVESDQRAYGVASLAMSHYVNAALDRVPEDVEVAAEMANTYLESLGLRLPKTRSSGTRVHRDVLSRMEMLPTQLRLASRPGLLGHLQTAAISAFLDELGQG